MPTCCAPFESVADRQFSRKRAAAELKRYRRKGATATTRLLEDGIERAGALGGTLLDIGSGVGSLTFDLLGRGIVRAVAVEASAAYIDAGREEAGRRGVEGAVDFIHADFVSKASSLPVFTVVALDRVVCCYPSCGPLLDAALLHAERCLALSYPRDEWFVRFGVVLENTPRRLARSSFRTYVHPPAKMEQMIRAAGFALSSRRETRIWAVDVYTR
jgi:magnesium-protoporphyrin O-methyltransferase